MSLGLVGALPMFWLTRAMSTAVVLAVDPSVTFPPVESIRALLLTLVSASVTPIMKATAAPNCVPRE